MDPVFKSISNLNKHFKSTKYLLFCAAVSCISEYRFINLLEFYLLIFSYIFENIQSRYTTRRIIDAKDNFNLKKNSFLFKEYNFISVRISLSIAKSWSFHIDAFVQITILSNY